jgi:hypothetical protein
LLTAVHIRLLKRWQVVAQTPDALDPKISADQEKKAEEMANTPPSLIPVYVPHIPPITDLPFEVFKQLRHDTSLKDDDLPD